MTETNAALLAGLPSDVRDLLANPPLTNTRLLELATNPAGGKRTGCQRERTAATPATC